METKREIGTFLSMQLLFVGAVGLYKHFVFGIFLLPHMFSLFYLATAVVLLYFLAFRLHGLEYVARFLSLAYASFAICSLAVLLFGQNITFNAADIYLDVLVAGIFFYIGFAKQYKRYYRLA